MARKSLPPPNQTLENPQFEIVNSDISSSFSCKKLNINSFKDDHTWHYHPEYELTWIIESHGTRFIGDNIQNYQPGDLVLVGPNLPHRWYNNSSEPVCVQPKLVVLQFLPDCLGETFFELDEVKLASQLLYEARLGLSFSNAVSQKIGPLLLQMCETSDLARLSIFMQVLQILSESPKQRLATPDFIVRQDILPAYKHKVERVHRFVREHLCEEISQAEIAAKLNMNAPAFSRFFKTSTGITFVAFVNTLRVHEACRMLNNTDLSVTEIAMSCGFNNISNFNRQFLSFRGMNPSEYRAHLKNRQD